MRIVINLLNFRPGRIGGAETYLRQLLKWLPRASGSDTLLSLCNTENADTLDVRGIERVVVPQTGRQTVRDRVLEATSPYRARAVEKVIEESRPDVVFYPQQSIFPKVTRWPSVLTVLDLQHQLYPQNFSLADRVFRKCIYGYSLRNADRIIAISASTKKSLIQLCDIPAAAIDVIHLGFEPVSHKTVERHPHMGKPYLYYPAATYRHKGHITLLRTMAQLVSRGDCNFRLVLTGQQTSHWRKIRGVIRDCRLQDHVEHLGFVKFSQVLSLYKGAAAVVFPTEFEGFGLPALEAASMGRKVIVSKLKVFNETGIPAECQIDFREPNQLRDALSDLRPTVLQHDPISWEQMASQTLHVLRTAANRESKVLSEQALHTDVSQVSMTR